MNTAPIIGRLLPLNDCVLVELQQSSKNFTVREGKYDSRTEGIVINYAASDETIGKLGMPPINLIGQRVHFEEYKEGARIKRDGKMYSFIKIEDIRGWEKE